MPFLRIKPIGPSSRKRTIQTYANTIKKGIRSHFFPAGYVYQLQNFHVNEELSMNLYIYKSFMISKLMKRFYSQRIYVVSYITLHIVGVFFWKNGYKNLPFKSIMVMIGLSHLAILLSKSHLTDRFPTGFQAQF